MSPRAARAVAIVCGLALGAGPAAPAAAKTAATSAKPSSSASTAKSKSTSTGKSKTKSKSKSKTKSKSRSHRKVARIDNMPPNWVWPPSRGMRQAGAKCLAKLDELGVVYQRAAAEKKVATPIIVPSMELGGLKLTSIWRKGPFVMDCDLALALVTYGPQLTAVGVKELQFSRIWGYTNVRVGGQTKPYLSRHALGLAIDVYAFVGTDDAKHVVETDYPAGDQFLIDVEDAVNASGGFRLCLTPKNDPISHHDHFHLEANVIYPAAPPPRVSAREPLRKR